MAGNAWIETTIGEQATLQRGIDITKAEQRVGKIPVISSGGVSSYHDTAAVKGPGVVLGRKGVVGSVYFIKEDYWPHDTSLWVKDFHGNDPRFVYYFFKSVAPQIARMDVGSANPTLNRNHVHPMPVDWPPLAEQKAIAAALGALDDKIELNRRMNATLEAMARALFQSWFVDFDPVRAKLDGRPPVALDPATAALFPDSFHDSPLGHIPTGWEAIPLYDTAQWVNGAAFKNEDFCSAGEGLPVIKIAELKDGISAQTKWCQRDAGPDKIIDTGDLVYSWSGSPDTSLEAFLWSGGRGLLNQHIFKVISPTAAEKRFVYYLLQYLRPVLVETARNKQTTGLGHVTIADMKRLLVCMPNKAVLAAFDRNVAPIFDKAFTNALESRTLATLRDTLLPKLLSGELPITCTGTNHI
jgi:type I restriction enzyme S subunit